MRRADELCDKLVGRFVVQRQRRTDLLNLAVSQHHDPVCQRHGFHLVVRHVHRSGTQVTVQLGNFNTGLPTQCGVQIGERLVKQKHLWRANDGAANRNALALPAREVFGLPRKVRLETQNFGSAFYFFIDDGLVHLGQRERKAHVFVYAHVRVQRIALEHHRQITLAGGQCGDVFSVQVQAARIDGFQPGDQAQKR